MKAFASYCLARYARERQKEAFACYIAEGLRVTGKNVAHIVGGSYLTAKFDDIIHPKPVDTRTGAEIAVDIIDKAGLKLVISNEQSKDDSKEGGELIGL